MPRRGRAAAQHAASSSARGHSRGAQDDLFAFDDEQKLSAVEFSPVRSPSASVQRYGLSPKPSPRAATTARRRETPQQRQKPYRTSHGPSADVFAFEDASNVSAAEFSPVRPPLASKQSAAKEAQPRQRTTAAKQQKAAAPRQKAVQLPRTEQQAPPRASRGRRASRSQAAEPPVATSPGSGAESPAQSPKEPLLAIRRTGVPATPEEVQRALARADAKVRMASRRLFADTLSENDTDNHGARRGTRRGQKRQQETGRRRSSRSQTPTPQPTRKRSRTGASKNVTSGSREKGVSDKQEDSPSAKADLPETALDVDDLELAPEAEVEKELHRLDHPLEVQSQERERAAEKKFPWWTALLLHGYSVAVHGCGSKFNVMQRFAGTLSCAYDVVIVNGFDRSLTARRIIDCVGEAFLGRRYMKLTLRSSSAQGIARNLLLRIAELGDDEPPVFVVVHSADAGILRSERGFKIIRTLAASPRIRFVFSVDTAHAMLLWDGSTLQAMRVAFDEVTTYRPLTREGLSISSSIAIVSSLSNRMYTEESARIALSGLNANARGIYRILVDTKLQHGRKGGNMLFSDLYTRARELFLVSSESTLRAQLAELVDHALVSRSGNSLRCTLADDILARLRSTVLAEQ